MVFHVKFSFRVQAQMLRSYCTCSYFLWTLNLPCRTYLWGAEIMVSMVWTIIEHADKVIFIITGSMNAYFWRPPTFHYIFLNALTFHIKCNTYWRAELPSTSWPNVTVSRHLVKHLLIWMLLSQLYIVEPIKYFLCFKLLGRGLIKHLLILNCNFFGFLLESMIFFFFLVMSQKFL